MRQPLLIPILLDGAELYQNIGIYPYLLDGEIEEVPDGMIVDGASVPRFAWWFLPPDGLHRAAALPHDDGYKRKGIMLSGRTVCRQCLDKMFYERMVEAGVNKFRAKVAYRMVRTFGNRAWEASTGTPLILPVRNAAPTMRRKPAKTPFTRHIYSAPSLHEA